jgi:hypothetical protein
MSCLVTRHGFWIGNWIYWILTKLQLIIALWTTACCLLCPHWLLLVTAPNTVDSSASMFTSLPATDCLITPHGCSPWPLTSSRVWPPLATTRYRRLALTSHLKTRLSQSPNRLSLYSLCTDPTENTASNISFIVVCTCCGHVMWLPGKRFYRAIA